MLPLPTEVVCGGILPYLSVCDMMALDTAYSNNCFRTQLRQVWKSYQYDSFDVLLNDDDICWLCGVGVRFISLKVGNAPSLNSMPIVPSILKTLRILHINSGVFYDTFLECIAANCPDLEELSVYCVDKDILFALAQNCRQLHTLRVSCRHLTDADILPLVRYVNQLHTICIDHAQLTDAGIQALCDNCPHLKHIELPQYYNLTDASFIAIADSYPHLESIHLFYNKYDLFDTAQVTDDVLIYFADKCHELRLVNIGSDNITSRGLTPLWAANPNLMDVNMSRICFISDDDIIQLVQCCPLLQKLNMSRCRHVTDAAVIAVAEHCPQLRSLDISFCYEVSDASLIALGQHCHELKSIDISFIKNISDVGIAALATGCPLLQEFKANNTTDAGVVALARGCRDLRIIEMRMCKLNGSAAISAIAENCPLVSELYLQNCEYVDDACLYAIAQHCHNLTVLDIDKAKILNAANLKAVLTSCRMLREISYSGCFVGKRREAVLKRALKSL